MTASASEPAETAAAGPGDDAAAPGQDATTLAGQALPPGGLWLWATAVDAAEGGVFTVEQVPETGTCHDGDVLVRVAEGAGRLPGLGNGHVQVCAVMDAAMRLVAEWQFIEPSDWPELARPAAAWAMGALGHLEEQGSDTGPYRAVSLADAVAALAPGWPAAELIELPGRPD
jgi:hypothetical protein